MVSQHLPRRIRTPCSSTPPAQRTTPARAATAKKNPTTTTARARLGASTIVMMSLLLSRASRNSMGGSAMLLTRTWSCRLRYHQQVLPKVRPLSNAAVIADSVDATNDNDTDASSFSVTAAVPQPTLLNPKELCPTLKPPAALSPSSIAEFLACPQSFLFQYLYGLKQPTSLALLKGRLCHSALEQLYDLSPIDRNVTNLHNLFRKNYKDLRDEHLYLFQNNESSSSAAVDDERTWGLQALQLLTNYMNTEDATLIQPAKREVWVSARFPIRMSNDTDDVVAGVNDASAASLDKNQTFMVRGIVDRLDLARGYDSRSNRVGAESNDEGDNDDDRVDPTVLGVVDYKTSQQPNLKYSAAMNRKIRDQSFFQLQIYALLLHERQVAKQQERRHLRRQNQLASDDDNDDDEDAVSERPFYLPVRFLRLLYLKSEHNRHADSWTLDLGSTPRIRRQALDATRRKLQDVYGDVVSLVNQQDPKAFVGCSRSFCYCHVCRPRFVPGTVWEPPV